MENGNQEKKHVSISSIDSGFELPWTIKKYLLSKADSPSQLAVDKCKAGPDFKCKDDCKYVEPQGDNVPPRCPLTVNPVSTTSQMNFQIIRLSR